MNIVRFNFIKIFPGGGGGGGGNYCEYNVILHEFSFAQTLT